MKHFTEEDLILYYYAEGGDADVVEQHLAICDSCQSRYLALQKLLDEVRTLHVPDRRPEYGSEVWQRVVTSLPENVNETRTSSTDPLTRPSTILSPDVGKEAASRVDSSPAPARGDGNEEGQRAARQVRPSYQPAESARWPRFNPFHLPQWLAVAAVALLVAGAFLAGRFWPRLESGSEELSLKDMRERLLLAEAGQHLERCQRAIVELMNAGGGTETDISDQQLLAGDLLAANRIYRLTATRLGETGLADVLDELERVLAEVAYGPSQLSRQQLDMIQRRIEKQGILFKVRVMTPQMQRRERITRDHDTSISS